MVKKYWLLKSEPTSFSINDLAAEPCQTTCWDGVRNYQARNLLRDELNRGDDAFIYHSRGSQPGIAGICRVVKGGYPDTTAVDPDSDYFDPRANSDNPIWYMVDVQLVEKFSSMISLSTLKKTSGLQQMVVTQRGSRLSVQPVRAKEWKIILQLVEALM